MGLTLRNSRRSANGFLWAELAVSLFLMTLLFTLPYITSQRAFLGGDINDGFYQFTIQGTAVFRRSPLEALQLIFGSLNQDYNRLFSLPLIPFILILGDSYLAYVISLAIVYLLPFCLTLGALATKLVPGHPRAVFAITTLIAVLFTPNWITLLQGYPDISAAFMVVLAIWVALRGVDRHFTWLLPDRWQVPLLGFLFSIGILLRRHFAYAVVAVLGAILIHTAVVLILELRRAPRMAVRNLFVFALRMILVMATGAVTLLALAWDFTIRAFTENYVSLYDSWSQPIAQVWQFYGELYGWFIWGLVLIGFLAGILTRSLSHPIALFISSFGLISILIWLLRLRYNETYYALHFAPFVILGIAAFAWTVWLRLKGKGRIPILILFALLLSANAIVSLSPAGNVTHPARPLLATTYPPPVRQNYNNVLQVMEFLRQTAPNREPIFVVYTGHLPMHLILAAERTVYGDTGRILNLQQGSPTDSDGFYPIEELLQSQYVVVTDPFVGWNEPQQQAIKAVHTAFMEGWEFTEDFTPVQEFDLQNSVTTTIYQRLRPTSPDRAVRLFHDLQAEVDHPLGLQPNWIALNRPEGASVQQVKSRRYALKPASTGSSEPQTFLYVGDWTERNRIRGRVVVPPDCGTATLGFATLNDRGEAVRRLEPMQFSQTTPLKLELEGAEATYLSLEVSNAASSQAEPDRCSIRVNHLVVSSQ